MYLKLTWDSIRVNQFPKPSDMIGQDCLIASASHDEPGILSYAIRPFCPTSADGLHSYFLLCTGVVPPPNNRARVQLGHSANEPVKPISL